MRAGGNDHAGIAQRGDLAVDVFRAVQRQCAGMAHAPLRRRRAADHAGDHGLLRTRFAQVSRRLLLLAAADFPDQDDAFGLRIGEKQLQAIDKAEAMDGVVAFWRLGPETPGIHNHPDGQTYLALTEAPDPPGVADGWFAEAARLSDDFELDQRGDRSVRLLRVIGADETEWGPVEECELQVDRG